MCRTVLCSRVDLPADDLDDGGEVENQETLDVAAAPTAGSEAVIATQCVAFSATFRVPVFYFAIHDTQGSPLPLAEIVKTPLFHRRLSPADITPFSIGHPGSLFPLLSQGDHPTLGTPSWYIHPCETPSAMAELAAEIIADTEPEIALWTEDEQLIRWMEAWFMLLGNVVDLDNP
ncbi:hypothetical protein EWM64_g3138 [Hericium alpestre]|uniref:Ubiquitin-like-conjugating enzyme ATG10 n=1 Tax=Hericium alpestre TaxID=135208 RepID=A0A4Z0A1C8_9AGAM|nr:hypothetical protein EWM64_g3138 [Hericium alpestre]